MKFHQHLCKSVDFFTYLKLLLNFFRSNRNLAVDSIKQCMDSMQFLHFNRGIRSTPRPRQGPSAVAPIGSAAASATATVVVFELVVIRACFYF